VRADYRFAVTNAGLPSGQVWKHSRESLQAGGSWCAGQFKLTYYNYNFRW